MAVANQVWLNLLVENQQQVFVARKNLRSLKQTENVKESELGQKAYMSDKQSLDLSPEMTQAENLLYRNAEAEVKRLQDRESRLLDTMSGCEDVFRVSSQEHYLMLERIRGSFWRGNQAMLAWDLDDATRAQIKNRRRRRANTFQVVDEAAPAAPVAAPAAAPPVVPMNAVAAVVPAAPVAAPPVVPMNAVAAVVPAAPAGVPMNVVAAALPALPPAAVPMNAALPALPPAAVPMNVALPALPPAAVPMNAALPALPAVPALLAADPTDDAPADGFPGPSDS